MGMGLQSMKQWKGCCGEAEEGMLREKQWKGCCGEAEEGALRGSSKQRKGKGCFGRGSGRNAAVEAGEGRLRGSSGKMLREKQWKECCGGAEEGVLREKQGKS
jgi:hypothetical protein